MKKRAISFLLAIIMVAGLCPLTAFAASTTTYITVKDDVPVWSSYSSSSTKKYTIADQGTLVYVTGWKINSSLNTWYQLSDGNWVYSGNVEKHTSHDYTGGICDDCGYEYPYTTTSMSSTTYIVTNTSGASIWSRPYSNNSTKKSTASYGSTLTIVGKTTNEDGNLWYKTSSGTWVYSGNVVAHTSHSYIDQGVCKDCGYTYSLTTTSMSNTTYVVTNSSGAGLYSNAYSSSTKKSTASYGSTLTIVASTKNAYGNTWYKTSSGYWVYSENVAKHTSHDYTGGICDDCGYEWPYTTTSMTSTTYVVTNTSGASIWSRPYSNNSTLKSTASYNTVLTIVGKTTNEDGNLWYKTDAGTWVYSGNVSLLVTSFTVTYNANGGTSAPSSSKISYGGSLTTSKPTRDGYTFLGWSTSKNATSATYQAGDKYKGYVDVTLYAVWEKNSVTCTNHDYTGGICDNCGYEWPYTTASMTSTTYTVTNASGASIWDRPYSNNSNKIKTASYGTSLKIIGKTTNEDGNLWYKTSDGYWVYSGNVGTSLEHECVASMCSTPTITYNALTNTYHNKIESYDEVCSCGAVVETISTTTKEEHDFTHGTCDDCGYEWTCHTYSIDDTLYQVTNTSGAAVYSMPYSDSTKKYTAKYGDVITVDGWTINVYGNDWYQLTNGYWIYKGNISKYVEPVYDASISSNDYAIASYVSRQDYDTVFGGYSYAATFVNDLSWYDGMAYSLQNWKSVFGLVGSGDLAETFMSNPTECQNVLANVVDSMCDSKTIDYIAEEQDQQIEAIKVILKIQNVSSANPLFDGLEDLDTLIQSNQDYSDDILILNEINASLSSGSLLGATATQLQKDYTYKYCDVVADILTSKLLSATVDLVDDLLGTKVSLVDSVLQFTLSNMKSLDAINDVVYLSTMRCESILAFRNSAKTLASGNFTQDDIDEYKLLFDLSKAFTIAEYEAMRSYYKSNSTQYLYLTDQIRELESMTYNSYEYATSYSSFK